MIPCIQSFPNESAEIFFCLGRQIHAKKRPDCPWIKLGKREMDDLTIGEVTMLITEKKIHKMVS